VQTASKRRLWVGLQKLAPPGMEVESSGAASPPPLPPPYSPRSHEKAASAFSLPPSSGGDAPG
jgi:hypothetical protein